MRNLRSLFRPDRGGRRRIKDRRVRVLGLNGPERRTGLKRRSGWDRRFKQLDPLREQNRRAWQAD